MAQTFVTVVVPFNAAYAQAVTGTLAEMRNPSEDGPRVALKKIESVHFMSLAVVEGGGQAHLLLELSADGDADAALRRVAGALAPSLVSVLADAGLPVHPADLCAFLDRHALRLGQGWASTVGLCFCGAPGMTVRRIIQEEALARRIGAMGALHGPGTPRRKLDAVREALWDAGDAKWAFVPEPAPVLDGPRPMSAAIVAAIVAAGVGTLLWPVLLPAAVAVTALFWAWWGWAGLAWAPAAWVGVTALLMVAAAAYGLAMLSRLEAADKADDTAPEPGHVSDLMARENHCAQNLLLTASTMKPGVFRAFALRFALWLIGQVVGRTGRPGFLGEVGVIHFARWARLPGTGTLLFWSNYDGAWEAYLEDFIELVHSGVTSIWSNTLGFPRTRWLFTRGAQDSARFRRWARRQQRPAPFWYSAYPSLTVERIRVNAAVRRGIAEARTDAEAADWLACFGAPRAASPALPRGEVPTLVFGARSHLRYATCLVLALPDNPAACGAWLAEVEPHVAYGDDRSRERATVLALSAGGLERLGLDDAARTTFPAAFVAGMTEPSRSRALGDVGRNDPEGWAWGTAPDPADALLLIYADTAEALDELATAFRGQALDHGLRLVSAIALAPVQQPNREPFGFRDGLSQPVLRGTPRAEDPRNAHHLVAAGEIVLGHPDNRGYRPATPVVSAGRDPRRILPGYVRPDGTEDGALRDLGCNGTFAVVRQLEQDTAGLERQVARAARALHAAPDNPWPMPLPELEQLLAAKIVGRWKDGSSLVRHPFRPGGRPDNDFLPGAEDPDGLRCPYGAHVRRANPRDSLDPAADDPLAVANRRRILRSGRAYVSKETGEAAGLLFMCFNADIERQFEFLQQSWLLRPSFHGLEDEADPMLGGSGRFTIPTGQGPVVLDGIGNFVTVRGGGYFFMPGRRAVRYLASLSDAPCRPVADMLPALTPPAAFARA